MELGSGMELGNTENYMVEPTNQPWINLESITLGDEVAQVVFRTEPDGAAFVVGVTHPGRRIEALQVGRIAWAALAERIESWGKLARQRAEDYPFDQS